MNPPALVVQQLALEGIGIDTGGRLVARPASGATDVPRLYGCRHAAGAIRSYRADVPDSIVARLEELSFDTIFTDVPLVTSILRSDAVCRDVWLGSTYTFRDAPSPLEFPDVVALGENHRLALENFDRDLLSDARPIYAILIDGEIASTCVSAREDSDGAEAWVQTASPFRRRGFARQVTAAWGHHALTAGKTAFYSHAATNHASRGVAASLDLEWLLDAVGYL